MFCNSFIDTSAFPLPFIHQPAVPHPHLVVVVQVARQQHRPEAERAAHVQRAVVQRQRRALVHGEQLGDEREAHGVLRALRRREAHSREHEVGEGAAGGGGDGEQRPQGEAAGQQLGAADPVG